MTFIWLWNGFEICDEFTDEFNSGWLRDDFKFSFGWICYVLVLKTKMHTCTYERLQHWDDFVIHLLKFGYSEKATKFEKIFHLKFDLTE